MSERLRVAAPPEEAPPQTVSDRWEAISGARSEKVSWLLPHRIVRGAVNLIEGDKGTGKSTLLVALAARLTVGRLLLGRRRVPPANVIWLAGEESYDAVVKPRLEAAGADLDRVHVPRLNERGERPRLYLPMGATELRDAVNHWRAGLVVLDPLSAHVPPEVPLTSDQEIHSVLDPLADLSYSTGCTVLCSRNLTKDRTASALHRGLGGAALAGIARSVLRIDWPDQRSGRRVVWVVSCNLTGERPQLEYHLADSGGVAVLERVKDLESSSDNDLGGADDPGERDVRADARLLLRRVIGSEWVPYRSLQGEAQAAGIGERTLRAVKADLGIRSRRQGGSGQAYWEWGPPAGGW